MKSLRVLGLFVFLIGLSTSCTGQADNSNEKSSVEKANEVAVYYFHNARRCTTCKAVEAESKKAVQELYGDEVAFKAYNLESEAGEEKAKEVGASGQSLLIVSRDEKINITNEGFMNARNNPEKLKKVIKEKTDPLI
jgi:hypothetical protein